MPKRPVTCESLRNETLEEVEGYIYLSESFQKTFKKFYA